MEKRQVLQVLEFSRWKNNWKSNQENFISTSFILKCKASSGWNELFLLFVLSLFNSTQSNAIFSIFHFACLLKFLRFHHKTLEPNQAIIQKTMLLHTKCSMTIAFLSLSVFYLPFVEDARVLYLFICVKHDNKRWKYPGNIIKNKNFVCRKLRHRKKTKERDEWRGKKKKRK